MRDGIRHQRDSPAFASFSVKLYLRRVVQLEIADFQIYDLLHPCRSVIHQNHDEQVADPFPAFGVRLFKKCFHCLFVQMVDDLRLFFIFERDLKYIELVLSRLFNVLPSCGCSPQV